MHRTLGASSANIRRARQLRREMTLPEVLLWRELKGKPFGLKFRKQFPLFGYVIDFACVEVRLLIEVDGIAHGMGDNPQHDEERDAILMRKGWQVQRIAAKEALADPARCADAIVRLAESIRPLRPCGAPPHSGEEL